MSLDAERLLAEREGWTVPDLPPLPAQVAVEMVKFARWRLDDYMVEREKDQSTREALRGRWDALTE